jgi:hypothetical protein
MHVERKNAEIENIDLGVTGIKRKMLTFYLLDFSI